MLVIVPVIVTMIFPVITLSLVVIVMPCVYKYDYLSQSILSIAEPEVFRDLTPIS